MPLLFPIIPPCIPALPIWPLNPPIISGGRIEAGSGGLGGMYGLNCANEKL